MMWPSGDVVSHGIDLVRLCDVEPEEVEWLWRARIPRGKVTLLVGDPGAGKSFASLAIAASITQGQALPDDDTARTPSDVLLWNGEDGLEDTIRVRAETVGAALERLQVILGTIDQNGNRAAFSLLDVTRLADAIRQTGDVSLVIVDPVAALLAGVDAHRDTEVRAALQPLVELARETRVAVLGVLHLRKGEAQRALYRVGGSIGFVGLARSVLLAATDPEDGRRAIAPLKSNLSALAPPIVYRIDDEGHWWWGATADDLDAEHLLRSLKTERGVSRLAAKDFLRNALAEGPRPAREIMEEAEAAGIPRATMTRARKDLEVTSRRVGGIGEKGEWMLSFPLRGSKELKNECEPLSDLSDSLWPDENEAFA